MPVAKHIGYTSSSQSSTSEHSSPVHVEPTSPKRFSAEERKFYTQQLSFLFPFLYKSGISIKHEDITTDRLESFEFDFSTLDSMASKHQRNVYYEPALLPVPSQAEQELSHKRYLFLDLDETLLHAFETGKQGHFSANIRPFTKKLIEILGVLDNYIEVVLWSAGIDKYILAAVDKIDPKGVIKNIICRESGDRSYNWLPEKASIIAQLEELNKVVATTYEKQIELLLKRQELNQKLQRSMQSKSLSWLPRYYHNRSMLVDNSFEAIRHSTFESVKVNDFMAMKPCEQLDDISLLKVMYIVSYAISYTPTSLPAARVLDKFLLSTPSLLFTKEFESKIDGEIGTSLHICLDTDAAFINLTIQTLKELHHYIEAQPTALPKVPAQPAATEEESKQVKYDPSEFRSLQLALTQSYNPESTVPRYGSVTMYRQASLRPPVIGTMAPMASVTGKSRLCHALKQADPTYYSKSLRTVPSSAEPACLMSDMHQYRIPQAKRRSPTSRRAKLLAKIG